MYHRMSVSNYSVQNIHSSGMIGVILIDLSVHKETYINLLKVIRALTVTTYHGKEWRSRDNIYRYR